MTICIWKLEKELSWISVTLQFYYRDYLFWYWVVFIDCKWTQALWNFYFVYSLKCLAQSIIIPPKLLITPGVKSYYTFNTTTCQ